MVVGRTSQRRSGRSIAIWRACRLFASLLLISGFGVPSAFAAVTDEPVLTTGVYEGHPAAGPGFLAWVQNSRAHPDHTDVYAKPDGGSKFKVNAPGTEGSLGAVDGTTLVYQQFGTLSDIHFFNLITHRRTNPPPGVNTTHWEYWPVMDRPWLLFARQKKAAQSRSVVLYNLTTHHSQVLDVVGNDYYVQPGQVNGQYAVWVHLGARGRSRIDVYDIANKTLTRVPNVSGYDWAPSVTENGTVYFERSGRKCGSNARIMRYPQGGPLTTVLTLPAGTDMGSTVVSLLDDGSIQVFHNRLRCSHLKFGSDIYRFVDDYTVTLSATVSGSGAVTSAPAGIDCTSTCAHEFEPQTSVTLTATPGLGSVFVGWNDPSCPGTDPCTVNLTSDTSVTATFNLTSSIPLGRQMRRESR